MTEKLDDGVLCPYCGQEMRIGYLAGGGFGLAFYYDERGPNFRMLAKFISGKCLYKFIGTPAYECQKCKTVIFRY